MHLLRGGRFHGAVASHHSLPAIRAATCLQSARCCAVWSTHCGSARRRKPKRDATNYRQATCRSRKKMRTIDRKSTRLNSSHLVISYAVFCLKKKKKTKKEY